MNTTNTHPRVAAAVQAWQRCTGAKDWPSAIDTMLIARWHGEEIAWPMLEGESFHIFRVSDSTVIDDDSLPCGEALRLQWQVFELNPPLVLASLS